METYSLTEEKCRVRRELKETAAGLSERYVAEASRAVCERVLQSREFQEAAVVFGYLSFHKEISVDAVLEAALRLGKMVAVPCIISRTEMKAARLVSLDAGSRVFGNGRPHGAGRRVLRSFFGRDEGL